MSALYEKLGSLVKGVLSGFDRIVFKGCLRPLMCEKGVTSFLQGQGILHKDYNTWVRKQTTRIVEDAEELSLREREVPVKEFRFHSDKKDELVREHCERLDIQDGLIGVWWAMEGCRTFKANFAPGQSRPAIKWKETKCKHLYFYFKHSEYGMMHFRLQTWFPFSIQVAMNGREWLCRSLERESIAFDRHRNKLLQVDDMEAAQRLLSAQLDVDWVEILNGFLPIVFPAMPAIIGPYLSYYWSLWQSEWATDHLFASPQALAPLGEMLLRHAMQTGTSERVLRYMDRPFTNAGQPYANNGNDVSSRLQTFADGLRVRHWVDSNSVKAYTEQNNLRVETTINAPGMFNVFRHKEGDQEQAPKQRRPMRKGVADIALRAQVSQQVNDRFLAQLASCTQEETLAQSVGDLCKRRVSKGRPIRALDPIGKDRELLLAIADPVFAVNGLTNRMLREKLASTLAGRSPKQAAAKVTRLIRLLRDHGLLAKMPKQRRYRVTIKGMNFSTLFAAALHASAVKLMELAA